MVILRAPILFEEMRLVKGQSLDEIRPPGFISRVFDVGAKAVQVIAGMKIVDPMILGNLGLPPGTIRSLATAAVFHGRTRNLNIFPIAGMFGRSSQHGSAKHIRIVN